MVVVQQLTELVLEQQEVLGAGAHNGVHLAIADGEVYTFQYLFSAYRGVQVLDFKHIVLVLMCGVSLCHAAAVPLLWDDGIMAISGCKITKFFPIYSFLYNK